jgi:hypothetical protein
MVPLARKRGRYGNGGMSSNTARTAWSMSQVAPAHYERRHIEKDCPRNVALPTQEDIDMKKCVQCGALKKLTQYYKYKRSKDGLQSRCKECMNKYTALYRRSHPEVIRKIDAKYRAAYPDKIKTKRVKWENENPDRLRKYRAKYYTANHNKWEERHNSNKMKCLVHYSSAKPECCWAGCNVTDTDMLQIDHIHNNGASNKKDYGTGKLYVWLIKNNMPEGYQVLCANHNWKKELMRRREMRVEKHDK